MRVGAPLAVAVVAALLYWPAFAEGEAVGTDTTAPQQQTLSRGELDALVVPIALVYMTKLYDLGFQLASTGNNWKKVPPPLGH